MTFFDRLSLRARRIDTLLCVGLDPRVEPGSAAAPARVLDANRSVIEATAGLALCYKPNIAFYEQHGPAGLEALARTIAAVPDDIPVILDAKRGDIGATGEAYAAAYRALGVDAVTVSPYMGGDSVAPFTASGLAIFVLCCTSNPGAADFQELRVDGVPLASLVAERALAWEGEIGLVVAGNDAEALATVRAAHPDAWLLAPGIGAQGGSMDEAVAAGLGPDGLGLLPVVARGISGADDPAAAARAFVERFREARDRCVGERTAGAPHARRRDAGPRASATGLLDAILDTGCLRFGEFTLKSGKVSPFYVDLRRLQSSAAALATAARAYERLLVGLEADRLAAVPVAALPLAAAATLRTGVGLIYPRLPAKPHGTGNRIEGEWHPGERAVLVDDLITTGKSKLEATAVLREEGLEVSDLVVLVERGGRAGGVGELAAAGIRVHAAVTISDLTARALSRSIIDEATAGRITAYLEKATEG